VAEASDNRQPLSKNVVGIAAIVLVVVIAVALGLYFLLRSDKKGGGHGATGKYKAVSAVVLTSSQIRSESLIIQGEQFFWAGPKRGYQTEFRRTVDGFIYVRYLPNGVHVGQAGDFLDIATYPFAQAVNGLKNQAKKAHATVVRGRGGSYIYVDPKRPRTVYMAFNGINYQVEIFGQNPIDSVTLAKSGKIRLAR